MEEITNIENDEQQYESKAIIATISATSRVSVKIKETFYTFEYTEKRDIPNVDGVDMELERLMLWETAHSEVDKQVNDVLTL